MNTKEKAEKAEKVIKYTAKDITILWKPERCTHAGICVKTLPNVYDIHAKPWIKPEGASTEALIDQINRCPSGALSYRMNEE